MRIPPLVSICCTAYNHEKYIRSAIEGFLMQKTTFPIEIIIHDDASTDNTAKIIMEYAVKNPDLIIPVLQTENQISKKLGSNLVRFVFPRAAGKYLALCDGDDFWTNPLKLQKQVDELGKYHDCYICFHPASVYDEAEKKTVKIIGQNDSLRRILSPREVILGGGGFMPTCSLVLNRTVFDNLPDWFIKVPVSDYYLQILGSLNGGALFLKETMSVYRINVKGSWTDRFNNPDLRLNYYQRQLEALNLAENNLQEYKNELTLVKRDLIKNLLIDRFIPVKARKEIFDNNVGYLKIKTRIAWNLIYKNKLFNNLLTSIKENLILPIKRKS